MILFNDTSLNLFEKGTLIEISNGKTVPIEMISENDFLVCEKSFYTPVSNCLFSNISNLNVSSQRQANNDEKNGFKREPFSCTFKTLNSTSFYQKNKKNNIEIEKQQ